MVNRGKRKHSPFRKVIEVNRKNRGPDQIKIREITNTPIKLITMPALAISPILMRPLPKIMAFGGVATGIIKAQDAETVAGIINNSGFICMATPTDARIGRIISVVAVLDVNSVKNVMLVQSISIITIGDTPSRPENLFPNIAESPVT